MTQTRISYEDKWEFLDEDQVIEVSTLPVFLAFLESEGLREFHLGYSDGRHLTMIAIGPDNTRVMLETSIAKFRKGEKERLIEVLSNTENDMAASQRHVMKGMMEAFLGLNS